MKKSTAIFLQTLIVLIGLSTLTFLIWEPQVEGVNANATNFEIYFKDPFLAYAYFASIPFFVALTQAFKVFGYARQNNAFTDASVKALRTIKYCGIAMIGFVIGGEIIILSGEVDDRPPVLFMGLLITLGSIVIAITAAKFERIAHASK